MAELNRVAAMCVAMLTIAACSTESPGVAVSTGDSGAPSTSASETTVPQLATADLDKAALARSNEVLAMAEADRNPVLFDAGMELELAVAHESGLEEALGGADATRAALGAAWIPVLTQAQAIDTASLSLGGLKRRAAPAVPDIGEGMFGAMLIMSLGASAGITTDIPAGPPVSEDNGNGFVISGSQNSTSLSYTGTHTDTTTGVTTTLETSSTVTPCPDANGSFDASGLMDVTVTKGSAGQHGTLDVTVVGQVDDDAHLVSSDLEYQMQWSKSSGGSAQLVDVTVKIPATGSADVTVNRSGGAATAALEQSATIGGMLYAMMMREALLKAAQEGWESGRCVRLDVTPSPAPKDMEPSSTAEIIAAPRSKIDGGPTGGTVAAT
ncbi:MAG TPA: hypothetical protein VLD86_12140, partial [Ilumatobacteraceae bacterium]|nr:hypothetical protein [Ilumatobacteraceae bacterium]